MAAATENDIALGVMQIAASQANRICTFKRAYTDVPAYVHLTASNCAPSETRHGEVMWQQLVRNIKSHSESVDNFVYRGLLAHVPKVGFRITDAGIAHLKRKGLL